MVGSAADRVTGLTLRLPARTALGWTFEYRRWTPGMSKRAAQGVRDPLNKHPGTAVRV